MTWHGNNNNENNYSSSSRDTLCLNFDAIHLPSRNFMYILLKITSRQREQQLQFAFSLPAFDMTNLCCLDSVMKDVQKKKSESKKGSHEWFVLCFSSSNSMLVSLIQDSHFH